MSISKGLLVCFSFFLLISCGNENSKISVDKADVMNSLRAKEDYVVATTVEGNRMIMLFRKGYGRPDSYVTQRDGIRTISMAMDQGVNQYATIVFMQVNCQTKEYKLKQDAAWEKVSANRSLVAYGVAYACELPALDE